MCIRKPADEYVYIILSRHLEKQLSFPVFSAQKGHFCALCDDLGIFRIFNFCPILTV